MSAELVSGHNTVTLAVTGESGPNVNFMRVFPLNDDNMVRGGRNNIHAHALEVCPSLPSLQESPI